MELDYNHPRDVGPDIKEALVPRILAKEFTAYDLLTRLVQEIQATPARLQMTTWFTVGSAIASCIRNRKMESVPACGTAACMAGWICLLTRGDRTVAQRMADVNDVESSSATRLLVGDGAYPASLSELIPDGTYWVRRTDGQPVGLSWSQEDDALAWRMRLAIARRLRDQDTGLFHTFPSSYIHNADGSYTHRSHFEWPDPMPAPLVEGSEEAATFMAERILAFRDEFAQFFRHRVIRLESDSAPFGLAD